MTRRVLYSDLFVVLGRGVVMQSLSTRTPLGENLIPIQWQGVQITWYVTPNPLKIYLKLMGDNGGYYKYAFLWYAFSTKTFYKPSVVVFYTYKWLLTKAYLPNQAYIMFVVCRASSQLTWCWSLCIKSLVRDFWLIAWFVRPFRCKRLWRN